MHEKLSSRLTSSTYDVLIIGAGINGAVTAAALASQGLKVLIADKGDYASGCSSNSSNLAWGGIKYLESHDYLLVNKLCRSRNHLMRKFPSSIREIRFLSTIEKGFRFPPLFIFIGSLAYWAFGRFFTAAPKYRLASALKRHDARINNDNTAGGVEYSDAFLIDNDSRFVFHFIRKALEFGANAENYVTVEHLQKNDKGWQVDLKDTLHSDTCTVSAKMVINAAGPWADNINKEAGITTHYKHLFSKGVHVIVDLEPPAQRVLGFFASDGRLFFVLPMGNKTCIGTTDTPAEDIERTPNNDDITFILSNANALLDLEQPLTNDHVISFRCGVRPLAVKKGETSGDWLQLSRKHKVDIDPHNKAASIYGGKLTDCINVGEEMQRVVANLGLLSEITPKQWYGEPDQEAKHQFFSHVKDIWHADDTLPEGLWRRWGAYQKDLLPLLNDPKMREVLVPELGIIRAEVYLSKKYERIRTLEDFLRRRYMVALVVRHDELIHRESTRDIAKILFDDDAEAQLTQYHENRQRVK